MYLYYLFTDYNTGVARYRAITATVDFLVAIKKMFLRITKPVVRELLDLCSVALVLKIMEKAMIWCIIIHINMEMMGTMRMIVLTHKIAGRQTSKGAITVGEFLTHRVLCLLWISNGS